MTAHGIIADVLLGLAAVVVLASSAGILVMRDTYRKLHYVTPIAVVAPVIVALAVLVQSGWTENSGQTWLGLLFMLAGGPFLGHATIRAARIRETGDWRGARAGGRGGEAGRAGARRRIGSRLTTPPGAAMGSAHLAAVVTPYTIPAPLMDVLQLTLLVLVAAGATAVVLIREPVRQVIMLSVYGVLLAVLFLAFQAPDVTLSELTVGAVALPVLLLLTLAKVKRREK